MNIDQLLLGNHEDKPKYAEGLKAGLQNLDTAYAAALNAVMNIAMTGTYAELGRLFDEGDSFTATPEMFLNIGDSNIDAIQKLIQHILSVQNQIEITLDELT